MAFNIQLVTIMGKDVTFEGAEKTCVGQICMYLYIPAIVCCTYSVNEQRQTNCFCCSGRFFVVVRVVLRSCVVTDVNALTVMLSYETPRRTGNTFSCLTTRIPRRLLFTLPGKSFTSSKRSLCQGKFCEKTNKRVKRLLTVHVHSVNESVSQLIYPTV